MAQKNSFLNRSTSGAVITGEGWLEGMFVNSVAGSMVIYHGTAAANTGRPIAGSITPPAVGYYYLGNLHTTAGVYVDIPGGLVNVTFHIREED